MKKLLLILLLLIANNTRTDEIKHIKTVASILATAYAGKVLAYKIDNLGENWCFTTKLGAAVCLSFLINKFFAKKPKL